MPKQNKIKATISQKPAPGDDDWGAPEQNSLLCFWTENRALVDLREFSDGATGPSFKWGGDFTGRPELITELAPELKKLSKRYSEDTVASLKGAVRAWFRAFDALDKHFQRNGIEQTTTSVADLTDLHRQTAIDRGMEAGAFNYFVRAVDMARRKLGFPQLHWVGPARRTPIRHVPDVEQANPIRHHFRQRCFEMHDHFQRADTLIATGAANNAQEELMLVGHERLIRVREKLGKALPDMNDLFDGEALRTYYNSNPKLRELYHLYFPNGADIRNAFFHCLASTGLNPSTLIALDVTKDYLRPNPKDPRRYVMWAYKGRSRSFQYTEGLYKSSGSPGMIIQALVSRTAPLRAEVMRRLEVARQELRGLRQEKAEYEILNEKKTEILKLERWAVSPWLYAIGSEIGCLNNVNYDRDNGNFLENTIAALNEARPASEQLPTLKPSDFRDLFAVYVYQRTGGSILAVMRALQHKRLTSSQRYVQNNIIDAASSKVFLLFTNSMWDEIRKRKSVDPTVLAWLTRHGELTDPTRRRLDDYRELRKSRLGIPCADPTSPPQNIAPNFQPDGKKKCPVQRCILCEKAKLSPESMPGIALRAEELTRLEARMPVIAFQESSFATELAYCNAALAAFDAAEVEKQKDFWKAEFDAGRATVPEFEGAF